MPATSDDADEAASMYTVTLCSGALVDAVAPGDALLVHAGTALAKLDAGAAA